MKLELLKKHLEEAVQLVSKVSNKNLSLPVLGCVVISATEAHTTLRATNLDVSVEVGLKSKVIENGIVAIPAAILSQSISTIISEKVTVTSDGSLVTLTTQSGKLKINTIDPSDFPTLPYIQEGEGTSLSLPTKEFMYSLRGVAFAAAQSNIRPELASVFMSVADGTLVTAATDSFRLAEVRLPIKTKQHADPILIPVRNIGDILRVVEGFEMVEVRIGENQITCIAGDNFITSRIVDGAFPEYHAIIPTQHTTVATVLKEDITRALKGVMVFTDQTGQMELSVDTEKKTLTFTGTNAPVGEAREALGATLEGESLTMFFNARYILDAMHIAASDSVSLQFSGAGKPMVVNEVPDKGFTYLVMPMNK